MDEGPLYKQKTLHLTGQESKAELTQQLQKLGSEMLIEILPGIADGSLKPHRQPHSDRATYSHKLTKEDGRISWPKPAVNLEREIRAYFGWPGSYTTLAGKEVIVTAARVEQAVDSRQQAAEPGDVFVAPHKQLAIQTGDGILVIERLRPAGGKEMPSMAFIAGHKQMLN
jgi:methionyl-tRNA formyltransferase